MIPPIIMTAFAVTKSHLIRLAWLAAVALMPAATAAQTLPTGPFTALDGQLAVSGEAVATLGDRDQVAFFNYTDYEHNVLRMIRIALSAAWRPAERIALVGEMRSEDFDGVRAYAAYVRVRPWQSRALDIQVGRIPPSFGAFGRRAYSADNPIVGYPLAYQYLTSLRPDAVPTTVDDLLRMRARGWRPFYPVGSFEAATGVPLVSAFRWDTGVQAHWSARPVEVTGAVTVGTLSDPRVRDNNDGLQLSGRFALHPVPGLVLGTSGARGAWLSEEVEHLLGSERGSHAQTAWGADAEYSRAYWLVRAEMVWSWWNVPLAGSGRSQTLDALAMWVDGRYRLTPRVTLAGRLDRLGFSRVTPPAGPAVPWDAPIVRVEASVSYYLQRNLVARLAVQHNDRDAGRVQRRTYLAGQLAYWF